MTVNDTAPGAERGPSWPARLALAAGAAGSLALMFWTGRDQRSAVLMAVFTLWVAAPFVALALAGSQSRGWSPALRQRLDGIMRAVGLGSLAVYGMNAATPFMPRPAAIFLIVPALTWVAAVVALAAVVRSTRR